MLVNSSRNSSRLTMTSRPGTWYLPSTILTGSDLSPLLSHAMKLLLSNS
jgi:hypothetical protein